jgi:hypothetical protein
VAQPVLGLQFDKDSVIITQVGGGLPLRPQAIVRVPVDDNAITKGSVTDPETVGTTIKQALRAAKPRLAAAPLHIVLPEELMFRKSVEVVVTGDEEQLRQSVIAEVAPFLPEEAAVMELALQPVPGTVQERQVAEVPATEETAAPAKKESKSKKATKDKAAPIQRTQQILVVATPKHIIQEWLAVSKAAGLRARLIEPRIEALTRLVTPAKGITAYTIIDLQREQITIGIWHQAVVWATTVLQQYNTEGPADQADAILEELQHLAKLYQNRMPNPGSVRTAYIVGTDPDRMATIMKGLTQGGLEVAAITLPKLPETYGFDSVASMASAAAPQEVYA